MMKIISIFPLLFICLFLLKSSLYAQTKHYINLPEYCPIPDNFALAPDGSLTLSCPNFNSKEVGVIVRITTDKKVHKLAHIPGKTPQDVGRPMGIDYAPDGSLFVCNSSKGEVNRLVFKDGKVSSTQTIAKGINPNGLKYSNGFIYVTDPKITTRSTPNQVVGGLYRFKISERNVVISDDENDPHLIFTAETTNPERLVGLDGLTFDKEGNLYVAEFGDASIYKLTLSKKGKVLKEELYAQLPPSTGIDGMLMDANQNLYVTGFCLNQLIQIDAAKNIKILAQYPDNNGTDGALDQPVDLCFFDGKLLISNFDLMSAPGMENKSHGKPYTISYFETDVQ